MNDSLIYVNPVDAPVIKNLLGSYLSGYISSCGHEPRAYLIALLIFWRSLVDN